MSSAELGYAENAYGLHFFDSNFDLIRVIPSLAGASIRIRRNSFGTATIRVAADSELESLFKIAAHVVVYRGEEKKFTGTVSERNVTDEVFELELRGHASILQDGFVTPKDWRGYNSMDLADVARDVLCKFKLKRYNERDDWVAAHERFQVDIDERQGSVILEMHEHEYHPGAMQVKENGYIVIRLDLGENAEAWGRRVRWTDSLEPEHCQVSVQTRSADTTAGLDAIDWAGQTEYATVHVDDYSLNEIIGVPVEGIGRWVDIRFNLYSYNVTRNHGGGVPHYGFTPELMGLEIIWREPDSRLAEGLIPAETGIIVDDFEFKRANHLEVLADICDEYEVDFELELDVDAKEIVLNLGRMDGMEWKKNIGIERTYQDPTSVVYRVGHDIDITVLRDSADSLVNVLHCWGAGSGVEQLYVELRDEASISFHGQEFHGDYENRDLTTISALTAAGNEELQKRATIEASFEIAEYRDDKSVCGLGDRITVVHPERGIAVDGVIEEESYEWSADSEVRTLGLNDFLVNPIDAIVGKPESNRTLVPAPNTVRDLSVRGFVGYSVLSWNFESGALFVVQFRKGTEGLWRFLMATTRTEYVHNGLDSDATYQYRVAAVRLLRISPWSNIVQVTIPAEEEPGPPPDAPNWAVPAITTQVTQPTTEKIVIENTLNWIIPAESMIAEYRIYRSKDTNENWQHVATVPGTRSKFIDDSLRLELDTRYYYALEARSMDGQLSDWSEERYIDTQEAIVPSVPTGLSLTPSLSDVSLSSPSNMIVSMDSDANVRARWSSGNEPALLGFLVETALDAGFTTEYSSHKQVAHNYVLTGVAVDVPLHIRISSYARKEVRILASWDANVGESIAYYTLRYRKATDSDWTYVNTHLTSHLIKGLEPGEVYEAEVLAVSTTQNWSDWSTRIGEQALDNVDVYSDPYVPDPINMPDLLSNIVESTYLAQTTFDKLLERHFFDTDYEDIENSEFDGTHIAPNTVRTQAMAIGSGTRNFNLVGIKMDPNTDDVLGKFSNTSGYLVLNTAPGEDEAVWSIAASTQTMAAGNEYWVYAKCSKTAPFEGTIELVTTRPASETANHYNFLIGMMFTDEDPAILAVSYGFTYVNGAHITTGVIDADVVKIKAAGGSIVMDADGVWAYSGGIKQAGFNMEGKWVAGGGSIVADAEGIFGYDEEENEMFFIKPATGSAYLKGSIEAKEFILPIRSPL